MTITIELSSEEEAKVRKQASRSGLTPEEYIRRKVLPVRRNDHEQAKKQTPEKSVAINAGAKLWDELERDGILTGYGDPSISSAELARQLRSKFSRRSGSAT